MSVGHRPDASRGRRLVGAPYTREVTPATPANPDQTLTLLHVRGIGRYNDWVFSLIAPHVRGRVLEVGCGIGTYTARLRPLASSITAVDIDPAYVEAVRLRFADDPAVDVRLADIEQPLEIDPGSCDTIVCLNVLEHLVDPGSTVERMAALLRPGGGTLVVQVPAHRWLFGSMDEAVGHRRRYTAASLQALLTRPDLDLAVRPRYLFSLGIPGWWWFGRAARRTSVPRGSVAFANALVGVSRWVDDRLRPPFGLTLVAVAEAR